MWVECYTANRVKYTNKKHRLRYLYHTVVLALNTLLWVLYTHRYSSAAFSCTKVCFNFRRVGVIITFAIRIMPPLQQMNRSQLKGAYREPRHGRRNRYIYNSSNDGPSPVKITPILLHLSYPPRVETASHVETVGRLLPVHPLKTAKYKEHTRKQPKKSSQGACCTTRLHTARKTKHTTLWSSSNLTAELTNNKLRTKSSASQCCTCCRLLLSGLEASEYAEEERMIWCFCSSSSSTASSSSSLATGIASWFALSTRFT